jgi:hypothetical protein
MRPILVLGILASGATVVAQSSSGTAAVVPAGPLQVELEAGLLHQPAHGAHRAVAS